MAINWFKDNTGKTYIIHILNKVSHFFLIEILSYLYVTETICFSLYESLYFKYNNTNAYILSLGRSLLPVKGSWLGLPVIE